MYYTIGISLRQILYRLHRFYRQVLSGDLRTLAGGFSLLKVILPMAEAL
jgi:hypothetical protein